MYLKLVTALALVCFKSKVDPSTVQFTVQFTIQLANNNMGSSYLKNVPAPNVDYTRVVVKIDGEDTYVDAYQTWYIKPTRPLAKAQFERLFGFGAGGLGHNTSECVFVPSPKLFLNDFMVQK